MAGIFDFESLYRVERAAPQVSHMFCCHDEGICVQDGVTEWVQPWVETAWVVAFQKELLISQDGINLWRRLIEQGHDAGYIIESVALGVGTEYAREKALTDQSQARLLKDFFAKATPMIVMLNKELQLVKDERDGPVFIPSLEWPTEMEEFENNLARSVELCVWLTNHFKPLAHAARSVDVHEGFYVSVLNLHGRLQLSYSDVATLLSAGYAVSDRESIDSQEVRAKMKSAETIRNRVPLQTKPKHVG